MVAPVCVIGQTLVTSGKEYQRVVVMNREVTPGYVAETRAHTQAKEIQTAVLGWLSDADAGKKHRFMLNGQGI
jgi:hypothetical protein